MVSIKSGNDLVPGDQIVVDNRAEVIYIIEKTGAFLKVHHSGGSDLFDTSSQFLVCSCGDNQDKLPFEETR